MVCQCLLYNKVNQLYIYICFHIPSLLYLPPSHRPYPTPLCGHKTPSRSPCAMQLLPTSYLFYVWQCIYVHATLSLCHSLPFPLPISSTPFSSRSVSEKLLTSPLNLNEILAVQSNLGCRFFSFITLGISFHSLLACSFPLKNQLITLWGFFICYFLFFPCCF